MIIVSDTSPVSNLILIERLGILQSLFGEIIIPSAVDVEIIALKQFGNDLSEYENADWIKITHAENLQKVKTLEIKLDKGEAQAIALALEINGDLLLMDERIGTTIAREEGLQTIGLVGVLLKAKEKRLVENVGDVLFDLKEKAGFWLDARLEKKVLEELGEL
jgi:uncharacterized protein